MTKDYVIIKCPKCGYEYVAAEIFFPKTLLGKPSNIVRDDDGHIILVEGEMPTLQETYECDNCGTTFKTTLSISSESKYNKEIDDEDDFVIDLGNSDKEKLF